MSWGRWNTNHLHQQDRIDEQSAVKQIYLMELNNPPKEERQWHFGILVFWSSKKPLESQFHKMKTWSFQWLVSARVPRRWRSSGFQAGDQRFLEVLSCCQSGVGNLPLLLTQNYLKPLEVSRRNLHHVSDLFPASLWWAPAPNIGTSPAFWVLLQTCLQEMFHFLGCFLLRVLVGKLINPTFDISVFSPSFSVLLLLLFFFFFFSLFTTLVTSDSRLKPCFFYFLLFFSLLAVLYFHFVLKLTQHVSMHSEMMRKTDSKHQPGGTSLSERSFISHLVVGQNPVPQWTLESLVKGGNHPQNGTLGFDPQPLRYHSKPLGGVGCLYGLTFPQSGCPVVDFSSMKTSLQHLEKGVFIASFTKTSRQHWKFSRILETWNYGISNKGF